MVANPAPNLKHKKGVEKQAKLGDEVKEFVSLQRYMTQPIWISWPNYDIRCSFCQKKYGAEDAAPPLLSIFQKPFLEIWKEEADATFFARNMKKVR